jgi:hypothetical protein
VGRLEHGGVRAVCTRSRSVRPALGHYEPLRRCAVEDVLLVGLAAHAGENVYVVTRTYEGSGGEEE